MVRSGGQSGRRAGHGALTEYGAWRRNLEPGTAHRNRAIFAPHARMADNEGAHRAARPIGAADPKGTP